MLKNSRRGIEIQVETNGTYRVDNMLLVDYWVVDHKGKDAMQGVPYQFGPGQLGNNCWVKFLVGSWQDFDVALTTAAMLESNGCHLAISSVGGTEMTDGNEKGVAKRIIDSGLQVTLNIQLHKLIGLL